MPNARIKPATKKDSDFQWVEKKWLQWVCVGLKIFSFVDELLNYPILPLKSGVMLKIKSPFYQFPFSLKDSPNFFQPFDPRGLFGGVI